MERAIINIRHRGDKHSWDLEVPAEIPAAQLALSIAIALGWTESTNDVQYRIKIEPGNRFLQADESLADAGVWDGSTIVLHPMPRPLHTATGEASAVAYLQSGTGQKYQIPFHHVTVGRRSAEAESPEDFEDLIDLTSESGAKTVSHNHASIQFSNGTWTLKHSAEALNPTWLNDQVVSPNEVAQLRDGDWLEFGDVRLQFHVQG